MTEEKILTKHPLGKSGKNISKQNYETIKQAIIEVLQKKELTHTELVNQVIRRLKGKFPQNISWYAETVKLDLEARKIIERTSSKPSEIPVEISLSLFMPGRRIIIIRQQNFIMTELIMLTHFSGN